MIISVHEPKCMKHANFKPLLVYYTPKYQINTQIQGSIVIVAILIIIMLLLLLQLLLLYDDTILYKKITSLDQTWDMVPIVGPQISHISEMFQRVESLGLIFEDWLQKSSNVRYCIVKWNLSNNNTSLYQPKFYTRKAIKPIFQVRRGSTSCK